MKKLALAILLAATFSISPCFAVKQSKNDVTLDVSKKEHEKQAFKIESGDCVLTIGGKTKIEHYFDRNIALLNRALPDEFNYLKNTFDLSFDAAYGKNKFGYNAVEVFTKIRHKGVWGRGAVFADSDGMAPAPIKLEDAVFGSHSHTSGKPLVWINEAWLQFAINAIADASSERLHTVKIGWFPFDVGRGISLGSIYGLNREGFGLNTYVEDKGAPGILLHGELKKDILSYDLYYAKFESRSKSLGDTLNEVKAPLLGRKLSPWRGVGKDNDLFAGRVKWKPLNESKFGTLELEPYAFYNSASDQRIVIVADSTMRLGTIGMALEHKHKSFEFGAEGAFNMGTQIVRAIDQNIIQIKRDGVRSQLVGINDTPTTLTTSGGNLVQQYSQILDTATADAPYPNALITNESNAVAKLLVTNDNAPLDSGNRFKSKPGRILPGYTNKLRGFMVVADITQKIEQYKLDLSVAYGFASGDTNPHVDRTDKTYSGFLGLHEGYSGKRVASVLFLDEMRGVLSIPGSLDANVNTADNNELAFTNMHHFGFGAKWKPIVLKKPFTLNPNMLAYYRAYATKKWSSLTQATTNEDASRFIGTEFNLKTKMELLKDLEIFGNFGVFLPGKMFKDIQGIPFKNSFGNTDFFDELSQEAEVEVDDIKQQFRLSTNVAYHANIGLTYAF